MAGYLIVGILMELSPYFRGFSPYPGEFICQSNLKPVYPTFLQGQVYKTILIWHVGYSEEILRFCLKQNIKQNILYSTGSSFKRYPVPYTDSILSFPIFRRS